MFEYSYSPIAGQGLGVFGSSLTLIGEIFKQRSFGQAGLKIYPNIVTGNVVVFAPIVKAMEMSGPIYLGYVYNSLAPKGSNWHFMLKSLKNIPNPPISGSITLVEQDGHTTIYTYNSAFQAYVALATGNGSPQLRYDSASKMWNWYNPKDGSREQYDAKGLLKNFSDAAGRTSTCAYDTKNQLSSITGPKGNRYDIRRSGSNVGIYMIANGVETLLQTHIFNASGVIQKTVLGYNDYEINYTYGTNGYSLTDVKQSDKTQISFRYDSSNRVYTIVSGTDGNMNKIDYSNPAAVRITDGGNQDTIISLDSSKRVVKVAKECGDSRPLTPTVITAYEYDPLSGQVSKITKPEGGQQEFTYDSLNLLVDYQGAMQQRTFCKRDQNTGFLIAEARAIPDGTGYNTYLSTRYVYDTNFDKKNHTVLRFELSPSGKVTEYLYDAANGNRTAKRIYLTAYDLSKLPFNSAPSLSDMQTWVSKQNPQQIKLTEYTYDTRGQVAITTEYTDIDQSGKGIKDAAMGQLQTDLTYCGKIGRTMLRQTETTAVISTDSYDKYLNRLTGVEEAGGTPQSRITKYTYDDANTKFTKQNANGRVETSFWSPEGLPSAKTESADGQTRQTTYKLDIQGRTARTTQPDGNYNFTTYDRQNRIQFEINSAGVVTEYNYDYFNGFATVIQYNNPVPVSQLQPYPSSLMVRTLLKPDAQNDRYTYKFYDKSGRLKYSVDSNNYLTEQQYDIVDRQAAKLQYAAPITAEQLQQLKKGQSLTIIPDYSKDRVWQYFYDSDSNKIGEQDPAGYVTAYKYDVASQLIEEVRYATATQHLADWNKVCPPVNNTKDAHHYYYRDARGQCIAEVNAEGYMLKRLFLASGKVGQQIRYANKVKVDPAKTDDLTQLQPDPNPEDQTTTYRYDALNRETEQDLPFALQSTTSYDCMDEVTGEMKIDRLDTTQARGSLSQYDGWEQTSAECNARLTKQIYDIQNDPNLTEEQKQAKISYIWSNQSLRNVYDASGLRLRSIDPLGKTTYYYYDIQRRLCYTVNSSGVVKQNIYNTFAEIVTSREYANFVPASSLKSLTGGFITASVQQLFDGLKDEQKDHIIQNTRDKCGSIIERVDAEGYKTNYQQDAFKQCIFEHKPVADKNPNTEVTHKFEVRGLETETTTLGVDLVATTSKQYQNQFGKPTTVTDQLRNATRFEYDRLAQPIKITDPLQGADQIEYDAFSRRAKEINALGDVTKHTYDQATRLHTIASCNPDEQEVTHRSEQASAFSQDEIVVFTDGLGNTRTVTYGSDGQITSRTNELKYTTKEAYNVMGWKVTRQTPDNIFTSYEYDGVGNLTRQTIDANGLKITTQYILYDTFGNKLKYLDPNSVMYCQLFDRRNLSSAVDLDPISAQNPQGLGLVTHYFHDNGQGQETTEVHSDETNIVQRIVATVYDAFSRPWEKILDPQGFKITKLQYLDAKGQVIAEYDPAGNITRSFYDANGNKRFTVSPLGNVKEMIYDAENKLICERNYFTAIDPSQLNNGSTLFDMVNLMQGKKSAQDNLTHTYYDHAAREKYKIDSYGTVVENVYDAANRITSTIRYATSVQGVNFDVITTDQLAQIIQPSVNDAINYRILDAAGQERFTIDPKGYVTEKRYDINGREITQVVYANFTTNPAQLAQLPPDQVLAQIKQDPVHDQASYKIYDTAGRLTCSVDALGQVTKFVNDQNGNVIQKCVFASYIQVPANYADLVALVNTLQPNKKSDVITDAKYDAANHKISETISAPINGVSEYQERTNQYQYDTLSHVEHVTQPDGTMKYNLYDVANRLVFEIDQLGGLIEHDYDIKNRYQTEIKYATKIDLSKLQPDPKVLPTIDQVKQLIVPNAVQDRYSYQFKDQDQKLCYEVDSANYLTEYRYDALGRQIGKIQYAVALTAEQLAQLETGAKLNLTPNVDVDRYWQYFYDTNNNKVGEQDPAGYLTEFKLDSFGRKSEEIRYATPTVHLATLDQVRPQANVDDSHHYFYWDPKSQCIAEIDAEDYMTECTFTATGKEQQEIRYANKAKGNPANIHDLSQLRPAQNSEDHTNTYSYDKLNREIAHEKPFAVLETTIYDSFGNQIRQQTTNQTDATQSRATMARYDGFGQEIAKCDPLIAQLILDIENDDSIPPQEKTLKIQAIWDNQSLRTVRNATGLKCSTIDPLGNVTVYYYDAKEQLNYAIDARGAIKQTIYNTFGEVIGTREYNNFVPVDSLPHLTGGFLTAEIVQLFDSLKSDKRDHIKQITRDDRGLIDSQADAEGYKSTYDRDAFKQCICEHKPVADQEPSMEVMHEFDGRGLETKTTTQSANLTVVTSTEYHNQYGKPSKETDAIGNATLRGYDHLGRLAKTTDPLQEEDTIEYDAFSRQVKKTTALGDVIVDQYDQATRTHTIINSSADGSDLTQRSEQVNAFAEVTTYANGLGKKRALTYAADGQVTSESNAVGDTTEEEYDLLGRKVLHQAADGIKTTYEYDGVGNRTRQVVDSEGTKLTTEYTEYDAFHNLLGWTDPRKVPYRQEFDRRNLCSRSVQDASTINIVSSRSSKQDTTKVTLQNPNGLNLITDYEYNGQGQQTKMTQSNQEGTQTLCTVTLIDEIGRKCGVVGDAEHLHITIQKHLNAAAKVIAEIDPNGKCTRHFYDVNGNERFIVNPLGAVSEFIYDANDHKICQRDYAQTIDPTKLSDTTTLAEVEAMARTAASIYDKLNYVFYDHAGRVRFTADSLGRVVEKIYDGASREITTRLYSDTVDPTALQDITTDELALLVEEKPNDRILYKILDDAGQERFTIDAAGYVVEQMFDQEGHCITKTLYVNPVTDPEYVASLPPDQVRAEITIDPTNDRTTYTVFDATEKPSFTVDGEGTVTKFTHDENGSLTQTCIFAAQIAMPTTMTYQELVAYLATLQPNSAVDRITTHTFDSVNREIAVTDALGNTDYYELNAFGKQVSHTDRAGNVWQTQYDTAMRKTHEITPAIYVESQQATMSVVKKIEVDQAGNQTSITLADGTSEARTVRFEYNAINQLILTATDGVPVDGEPTPVTVSQSMVCSAKKLPIVEVNENNSLHFYVYDSQNQLSYEINELGAVTEYQRNAFGEVVRRTQYANPLQGINLSDYAATGLTIAQVEAHVVTSADDRVSETVFGKRGEALSKTDKAVFYYIPDSPASRFGTRQPETRYLYNVSGKVTCKKVLIDPEKSFWSENLTWYDRNDKEVAETDPNCYLKRYHINPFGDPESATEYANPLPFTPTTKTTLAQLDSIPTSEVDRHFSYEYNLLGKKTKDIRQGVVVQELELRDGEPATYHDLPPQDLVEEYKYDVREQQVAACHEDGSWEYMYYDACGNKTDSTEVARQSYDEGGNSITLIPLTHYGFNCCGQTVLTLAYKQGTAQADLNAVPQPIALDSADQYTRVTFDCRGLKSSGQDAETNVIDYSYTRSKKQAQQRQLVSFWDKASKQYKQHTVSQTNTYNAADGMLTTTYLMDVSPQYQAQYFFNTLGQQTGEGLGDGTSPAYNRFDTSGNRWSHNDGGAASIVLYDLAGRQTAALKSPNHDLSTVPYDQIGTILSTWGQDMTQLERQELFLDPRGKVVAYNITPPYTRPNPNAIEDMPVNMVVGTSYPELAALSLSWFHIMETNLVAPKVVIWPTSNPTAVRELPLIEQIERMGCDLSGLSTDVYSYRIDYYLKNPLDGTPTGSVKYSTQGTIQVDTGDDTNSTALVVIVQANQTTLNLSGKTINLNKVELWQNGQLVAEVPIKTNPSTQQLYVDLAAYPTGEYQLKPYYNDVADNLSLTFTIQTPILSPTPHGQEIECKTNIAILDSHGQVTWQVPSRFSTQPIKITCEYIDENNEAQVHQDVILPGTDLGHYTDKDGKILVCNSEFPSTVKAITHLHLELSVGNQWIPLVDEVPLIPLFPPDIETSSRDVSTTRTRQLVLARECQAALSKEEKAALLQKQIQAAASDTITTTDFIPTTTLVINPVASLSAADTYKFSYVDYAMDRMKAPKELNITYLSEDQSTIAIDASTVVTGLYPYKLEDLSTGQTIIDSQLFSINRASQVYMNTPLPPVETVSEKPLHHTEHDAWGNQTAKTDTLGNRSSKTYNYDNKALIVTAPAVQVTSEHGQTTTETPTTQSGYNARGVEIAIQDAEGNVEAHVVNAAGQTLKVIEEDGTVSHTEATDALSRRVYYLDSRGKKFSYEYNHLNAVTKITYPSGKAVTYTYNELGTRASQTNGAGETTHFNPDSRGDVAETYLPEGQATTYQYDWNHKTVLSHNIDGTLSWHRDYFGNELSMVDLSGATYTSIYDYKRQLTARSSSGGYHGWMKPFYPYGQSFKIGDPTNTPPFSITNAIVAGQVRTIQDLSSGKTIVKTYDTENRPLTQKLSYSDGTILQQISTTYDSWGRITRSDDVNSTFSMGFDARNNRRYVVGTVYVDGSTVYKQDWSTYDRTGKILTDRGLLQDGNIVINSSQGTQVTYTGDFRATQYAQGRGTDTMHYDEDGLLISTTNSQGAGNTYRLYDQANRVYHYSDSNGSSDTGYDHNGDVTYTYQTQNGNWTQTWFDSFTAGGSPRHQFTKYSGSGNNRDDLRTLFVGFQSLQICEVGGRRSNDHGTEAWSSATEGRDSGGAVECISGSERGNGYFYNDIDGKMLLKWSNNSTDSNINWQMTRAIYDINGNMLFDYSLAYSCSLGRGGMFKFPPNLNVVPNIANLTGFIGVNHAPQKQFSGGSVFAIVENVMSVIGQKFFHTNTRVLQSAHIDLDYFRSSVGSDALEMIPTVYVVTQGDTFSAISRKIFCYDGYADKIAQANGFNASDTPPAGYVLTMPQIIPNVNPSNANTPYERFIAIMVGTLYPHLKTPQPKPKSRSFFSTLVKLVAVVVICVIAYYLGPLVFTLAGKGLVGMLASGAAVGAMSSAINQGVAIGLGEQHGFSFKSFVTTVAESMATAGLTYGMGVNPYAAGVTNGIGQAAQATTTTIAMRMFEMACISVATQLGEMATGLRSKFDFGAVALAATSAGLDTKLGKEGMNVNLYAKSAITTMVTAVETSLLYGGRMDLTAIAANFVGSVTQGILEANTEKTKAEYDQAQQDAKKGKLDQTQAASTQPKEQTRQSRTRDDEAGDRATTKSRSQQTRQANPDKTSSQSRLFSDSQSYRKTAAASSSKLSTKSTSTTKVSDAIQDAAALDLNYGPDAIGGNAIENAAKTHGNQQAREIMTTATTSRDTTTVSDAVATAGREAATHDAAKVTASAMGGKVTAPTPSTSSPNSGNALSPSALMPYYNATSPTPSTVGASRFALFGGRFSSLGEVANSSQTSLLMTQMAGIPGVGPAIMAMSFPGLLPDYVTAGVNFALPLKIPYVSDSSLLQKPLSWGLQTTVDRYGDVYAGGSFSAGVAKPFSFNVAAGWMNQTTVPSRQQLETFNTGIGYTVGGGYEGFYAGEQYAAVRTATLFGIGTPQIGGEVSYTRDVSNTFTSLRFGQ